MPKRKIGFTCGSFDLLHAGHAIMLKDCKNYCNYLKVGLQTDPTIDRPDTKNKPIQTIEERYLMLEAIKYVDEIIVYSTEEELLNILKESIYDVRILGTDWEGKEFTGYNIPNHLKKCIYHDRNHTLSSTFMRERIYNAELEKRQQTY